MWGFQISNIKPTLSLVGMSQMLHHDLSYAFQLSPLHATYFERMAFANQTSMYLIVMKYYFAYFDSNVAYYGPFYSNVTTT